MSCSRLCTYAPFHSEEPGTKDSHEERVTMREFQPKHIPFQDLQKSPLFHVINEPKRSVSSFDKNVESYSVRSIIALDIESV